MGILQFLNEILPDYTPKRRKQKEDPIKKLGLSANPDISMAQLLGKLERERLSAERHHMTVRSIGDPGRIWPPDPWPHGVAPPPGGGYVNPLSVPLLEKFKKRR